MEKTIKSKLTGEEITITYRKIENGFQYVTIIDGREFLGKIYKRESSAVREVEKWAK